MNVIFSMEVVLAHYFPKIYRLLAWSAKIWLTSATFQWRHVTLFLQFIAKNFPKGLIKCWCQPKGTKLGLAFFIYLKEHCITFKLRGRPSFYHIWGWILYSFWRESPNFRWFSLRSLKSCWRQPNFCWPSKWSVYFWKVVGLDYFHTENHVYTAICSNFRVGVKFYPPSLILTHIKSPMNNRDKEKTTLITKNKFLRHWIVDFF